MTESGRRTSLRFQPLKLDDDRRVFDDGFGAEVVHSEHFRAVIPRTQTMSLRRPRWVPILVVLVLAGAAFAAVPSVREPVLRTAGWALVVNEPVTPADIIVVSLDSGGAGALEAADLVQIGIATRVAVFTDPPNGEDHEFIRRGLPYEDASARQIRQLKWLGVTEVLQIPRPMLEPKLKVRCFRHGATSISSDPLFL